MYVNNKTIKFLDVIVPKALGSYTFDPVWGWRCIPLFARKLHFWPGVRVALYTILRSEATHFDPVWGWLSGLPHCIWCFTSYTIEKENKPVDLQTIDHRGSHEWGLTKEWALCLSSKPMQNCVCGILHRREVCRSSHNWTHHSWLLLRTHQWKYFPQAFWSLLLIGGHRVLTNRTFLFWLAFIKQPRMAKPT